MPHINDGQIHAWLDGALEAHERVRIEEHIAGCAECRSRVEEEREIIAEASRILAVAAPPALDAPPFRNLRAPRPPRRGLLSNPMRLAWAASLVLALGIGWLGRSWIATDMRSEASVEVLREAGPDVEAERPVQAAESAPAAATPAQLQPPTPSDRTGRTAAPAPTPQAARMTAPQTAPVSVPRAAPMVAQSYTANDWVPTTADVAEEESGMKLVRFDGAELLDVAIRRTIDRVEVRTHQRLHPDTAVVELVQMREPQAIALREFVATAAADSQGAAKVQADSTRDRVVGGRAQGRVARVAAAADSAAAKRAATTPREITIVRDGMTITVRAVLSEDSLNALLQRIR